MKTSHQVLLKAVRAKLKLTQRQLGDLLRVTNSAVCRWEKGNRPISNKNIQKLLDLYQENR